MEPVNKPAVDAGTPTSSLYSSQAKGNAKMLFAGLGGVVIAAVLVALVVGVVRVYAFGKTDAFTVTVAKVLRLPAMKVNGESVLYSDYTADLSSIYKLKAYDVKTNGSSANLTDQEMSDQVLWRLANNILLANAATDNGVVVAPADVDTIKAQILKQFPDAAAASQELEARYGWTLDEYSVKVIAPYVIHNKLTEKISADQSGRETVRALAQKVLDEVKAGKDFAEEAKQYGQDGTAIKGGELGFFAKGDMVPEFENAAFALKKGELSANLVETEYGYHIIQVEDKKTVTAKDATTGKTVSKPQVQARHILFRFPSADTYLDTAAKNATYRIYIKVHNPFPDAVKYDNLEK